MKEKIRITTINLEHFELPCSSGPGDESVDNDDGYERDKALEDIEKGLPVSAVCVGVFQDEVDNFTSWKVEVHFFIYPWSAAEFDWALLRIRWDDNWGRWEVKSCGRVAGERDRLKAAEIILAALVDSWGYNPKSSEYRKWKQFIKHMSI